MRATYICLLATIILLHAQEEGRRRQREAKKVEAPPKPTVQSVTITGRIVGTDGEPLSGAYIKVKGTVQGSVADLEGNFKITLLAPPDPVELEVSFVGYEPKTEQVPLSQAAAQGLMITLQEAGVQAQEVVISSSRVPEAVMQSPVTVLKMSSREVLEAPGLNLFQNITFVKGAEQVSSSLTFQIINTRGFNSTTNTRFVQRLDGVEMQAPALNFAVGTITNAADLDIASVEFIPGPASALYGPNAFSGILNVYTKDPFQYPGFSASVRIGVNHSDRIDTTPRPLYDVNLRYAKAWGNRFGIKVFANILDAHDWVASDPTDRGVYAGALGSYAIPGPQNPGYDAVNKYGDEARIGPATVRGIAMSLGPALGAGLPRDTNDLDFYLARTGYWEREIIQYNARVLKGSLGAYYRLTDKLQLNYQAFASTGATVYQGVNRYSVREFLFSTHKVEVVGPEYRVWAYGAWENSGNSFDARFAALNLLNLAKTHNAWMVQYVLTYTGQLHALARNLGLDPDAIGIPQPGNHAAARAFADSDRATAMIDSLLYYQYPENVIRAFQGESHPAAGSDRFKAYRARVIEQPNFAAGGAQFFDRSSFYHIEGQYDLSKRVTFVQLLTGGNFRYYLMNSRGTIFSDTSGPLGVWEGGAFVQASKAVWAERLRLLGSLRYDKNMNFQGRVTPRIAAILALDQQKHHNLRLSYQTGFRMPSLQAQYIDLDIGPFRLIGGLRSSDEYYGIIGNNYSQESVRNFLDSLRARSRGTDNPNAYADLLRVLPIENVKPERVSAIEVGTRHLIANRIYIDIDYAYSRFTDFLGSIDIAGPVRRIQSDGTVQIDRLNPDSIAKGTFVNYRRYYNTSSLVYTHHAAIALQYTISKNFFLNTNFTYAEIVLSEQAREDRLIAQFNTPRYRANVTFTGRDLLRGRRWGFMAAYRWINAYLFEESFHERIIPTYQLVDVQVSYKIPKWRSLIRVGGQNILNNRHVEVPGGPTLGSLYYIQFVYDPFLP
jgi:outer membrane receptor protein involved in Fe transport